MPETPYERQLLVCTYGPWCVKDGSDAIRAELKGRVHAEGFGSELRVTKSGCLGQCGNGPMAVLWPDNVWYHKLSPADVDDIMSHLRGGPPVERLRYRPARPGSNKTDEVKAKEALDKKRSAE